MANKKEYAGKSVPTAVLEARRYWFGIGARRTGYISPRHLTWRNYDISHYVILSREIAKRQK